MAAKKLKILTDENVHGPICEWLAGLKRIDLMTAKQAGLLNRDDEEYIRFATERGRVLLASDKAFAEHAYRVCTHSGIINVAQFNNRPHTCKKKLSRVLRRARKMIPHNILRLEEHRYVVVVEGHAKRPFPYA